MHSAAKIQEEATRRRTAALGVVVVFPRFIVGGLLLLIVAGCNPNEPVAVEVAITDVYAAGNWDVFSGPDVYFTIIVDDQTIRIPWDKECHEMAGKPQYALTALPECLDQWPNIATSRWVVLEPSPYTFVFERPRSSLQVHMWDHDSFTEDEYMAGEHISLEIGDVFNRTVIGGRAQFRYTVKVAPVDMNMNELE